MQSIDSFRPPAGYKPKGSTVPPPHPRMAGGQDGASPRPVVRQKTQPTPAPRATGARFTKLASHKKSRHIPWPSIIAVLASVLLVPAAQFGLIGMGIAALCAVALLVFRLPSRLSFIVSLMGLLYVIGLQFSGSVKDAQAVAGLVYIFFVGGGVGLAFEVRRDKKLWFKKHY